jgi:uncharacterized protein YbjT (DUF2867 family)
VARVVKLSVLDGGGTDDIIGRWSRQAEEAVTSSAMEWTLLRPGRFMSNTLAWAPMMAHGDTIAIPFASRPAASIDPADVAAVAAVALTQDGHAHAAYELSGPEVLTPQDELLILAATLHRSLQLIEPSIEATRAGMVGAGMPKAMVDAIIARVLASEDGFEVLPTVEQVVGRPAATFAQWAQSHTGMFTDAA